MRMTPPLFGPPSTLTNTLFFFNCQSTWECKCAKKESDMHSLWEGWPIEMDPGSTRAPTVNKGPTHWVFSPTGKKLKIWILGSTWRWLTQAGKKWLDPDQNFLTWTHWIWLQSETKKRMSSYWALSWMIQESVLIDFNWTEKWANPAQDLWGRKEYKSRIDLFILTGWKGLLAEWQGDYSSDHNICLTDLSHRTAPTHSWSTPGTP